jgi:hypothetical protein
VTEGKREQDREVGGMSTRAASWWLAWSLAVLSVAMFLATVALFFFARSGQHVPPGGVDALADLLVFVPFLAFPVVGVLIASGRPHNPIGWLCLIIGLFWMLIAFGDQHDAYVLAKTGSQPSTVAIDALTQWTWLPPVGLLAIYTILLFPDGRLPSRRWRPLAWFSGAVMLTFSVATILAPGPLEGHPGVRNPFGLEGHPWVGVAAVASVLLLPVCILASASSLVVRFRRSGTEARQQIKWLAFAASLVGLVYMCTLVSELVFVPGSLVGGEAPPLWVEVQRNLLMLSYAGVPVAIGFAVLRYRLYDIDLIINRALVYGSLTVLLATTYVGSVVGLQAVLRVLSGQESTLAVVASTLLIAALFNPLRRRVQGLVDRRFYRRKYDAAKTLAAFNTRLREETDLEALSDDVVGVARGTVQPAHVSLWLRPDTASRGQQTE